jgi:hypothetical protein
MSSGASSSSTEALGGISEAGLGSSAGGASGGSGGGSGGGAGTTGRTE